jgi:PAS domain S-box-containing protein
MTIDSPTPVIDAAADAIVAVDRDGRITHWNTASSALLGHPSSRCAR